MAAERARVRGAVGSDPLGVLPIRLTYRTARVLEAVAELTEAGVRASNREIADRAGIGDAGQTSKLLARLRRHGLLENTAVGSHARGEANRWRLTSAGRRVVGGVALQAEMLRRRSAA